MLTASCTEWNTHENLPQVDAFSELLAEIHHWKPNLTSVFSLQDSKKLAMTLTRDRSDHILCSRDSHEIWHASTSNFFTSYSLAVWLRWKCRLSQVPNRKEMKRILFLVTVSESSIRTFVKTFRQRCDSHLMHASSTLVAAVCSLSARWDCSKVLNYSLYFWFCASARV